MRRLARYSLMIVCTLALIGGSTVSFAASLSVNCAHEHSHSGDTSPDHHKHHGSGCLSCCLGACAAVPDLPPRTAAIMLSLTPRVIAYWEPDFSLPGRSITPDLGPPRSQI